MLVTGCLLMYFTTSDLVTGGALAQDSLVTDQPSVKYTDDKYDFTITVAPAWKSAPLQGFAVPGVARAAYSGQGGASIVVFVQEPGKDYAPRFLVEESAKGMEQGLKATVKVKEVRAVAGKQAMWMVVEGKGSGAALDGKSEVPTTQHWVAVPREKDIVVILLTCSTADYQQLAKSFEASLKKLTIGGKQTATQTASK